MSKCINLTTYRVRLVICLLQLPPSLIHSFTLLCRQWKTLKYYCIVFIVPFCVYSIVSRRTIGERCKNRKREGDVTRQTVYFMMWCNVYYSWFSGNSRKMTVTVTNQSKENKQVHLFHSSRVRERERKRRHFSKTKELSFSFNSLFTLFTIIVNES